MIIMLLLWMMGIYTMYLQSYFTMLKRGNDQVIGEYKAVFELANAMQTQLARDSKKSDVSVLTEKELRRRITKGLNGGSISFQTTIPLNSTANSEHNHLSSTHTPSRFGTWLKKEKWWLLGTVLLFVACIVMVVTWIGLYWPFLVPLELPFIVYVGQSGRSRGILSFWMFWVWCVRGLLPFMLLWWSFWTTGNVRLGFYW
jgi:hypothetical protein